MQTGMGAICTKLKKIGVGARTLVMGILNVTPDSFYDGRKYGDTGCAVGRGMEMAEEGADVIDIGGESTRPGSRPVAADEELRRVIPVVEQLAGKAGVPLSIDTYKSQVAERALDAGATMVNDVSALRFDDRLVEVVAKHDAPVVLMHMQGTPRDMQQAPSYGDVVEEIGEFLRQRLRFACDAGVPEESIVLDPGIGFGKALHHNLQILGRLPELLGLGRPVLLGTSRKAFIGGVLNVPVEERLFGTAATLALAVRDGVSMVRVHDVREAVQVVRMAEAICAQRRDPGPGP